MYSGQRDIQIRKSPAPAVRGMMSWSMSQELRKEGRLLAKHLTQHVLQCGNLFGSECGNTILQTSFVYSTNLVGGHFAVTPHDVASHPIGIASIVSSSNTSANINLSSPSACACLAAAAQPSRGAIPASFFWARTKPLTKAITFVIADSLSSSGFISRNSSARSCIAVIILTYLVFGGKGTNKRAKCKINRDLFSFPSGSTFERSSNLHKISETTKY